MGERPELVSSVGVLGHRSIWDRKPMPSPAFGLRHHETTGERGYAEILTRCAGRDPKCVQDLERAFGEPVRTILARGVVVSRLMV